MAENQTTSDNNAFAGRNLTRWPVYATKERLLLDLIAAEKKNAINDIIQRLSNTDTSTWADKGSRMN